MQKLSVLTAALTVSIFLAAAQETNEVEGTTIQVAEHETLGPYLTDVEGMALYLFLNDGEGTSTCYDQCAQNWPPLLTEGEPVAGEGVDAGLLGTTERDDGAIQVTYNGWPLYYFVRDDNPGDISGQEAGEVWYLVSPAGEPVGAEGDTSEKPDEEVADEEAAEGEAVAEEADEELFAQLMSEGEEVYGRVCATCHGARGTGGQGVRLVGHPRLDDSRHVIDVILRGFGYMPPLGNQLSDYEVAAAATYVRNSWDNEYGVVTEQEVEEMR